MMENTCPHCGTSLPRLRDAFCPECLTPLDSDASQPVAIGASLDHQGRALSPNPDKVRPRHPLESFSLPARLVIVLSVIGAFGGTAAYLYAVYDGLPPGSYPLWLFALPVIVVAGFACAAGLALLRAGGVAIFRPDDRTAVAHGHDRPEDSKRA